MDRAGSSDDNRIITFRHPPTERPTRTLHTFQHLPLDHDKPSIRLVEVHPDLSDSGCIQCSMQHAELPSQRLSLGSMSEGAFRLTYFCLSYTWGDRSQEHTILINGSVRRVHLNLLNFLEDARRRRYEGVFYSVKRSKHQLQRRQRLEKVFTRPLLWIDALCIDQTNVIERNHQVQQMGAIYSNATKVFIWLGGTTVGNAFLCEQAKYDPRSGRGSTVVQDEALRSLFTQFSLLEYWSRAWITQEVLLAKHALICVESGFYDFGKVSDRCLRLGLYQDIMSEGVVQPAKPENAFIKLALNASKRLRVETVNPSTRLYMRHTPSSRFLDLPDRSIIQALDYLGNEKKCANIQDRIYSLLSLCETGRDIKVDYNVNRKKLMYRTLVKCERDVCFCSAAIVAHTLGISPFLPKLQSKAAPFVQFTADDCRYMLRCPTCEHNLPTDWLSGFTAGLCLRKACGEMDGHLAYEKSRQPNGHVHDVRHCSAARFPGSDMTIPVRIGGIEVSPCSENKSGTTMTWRFTFNALLYIVAQENRIRPSWGRVKHCQRGKWLMPPSAARNINDQPLKPRVTLCKALRDPSRLHVPVTRFPEPGQGDGDERKRTGDLYFVFRRLSKFLEGEKRS